jgi:hypothetical protein
MTWLRQRAPRDVLPSEKGFLELAGRAADLPLRDVFINFRDLVSADMDWADSRKVRFRTSASRVRVASLVLTALSTIVLGIPAIPSRASIALPMVALVTVLGGLETFFNWRSRWVLMEEAQYRLNRIRDEIDYYLVVTPSADITREKLDEFFQEQQAVWNDVSRRWVEYRKLDRPPSGEQPPDIRSTI